MASSSDALQQPYPKQQQLLQLSTDDGFLNCLSTRDKIARAARALAEREERIANLEAAALESERARAEQAALYATLSTQLVGLRAQAAALAAQRKSEARVAMAEARLKGGVPRPGYTVAQRVQEAEAAKVSSHRSEVSSHRGWEQPQGSPVFSETAAQRAVRRVSQTLRENHARVTDLMNKWDLDGDGKIDRHEFQRAMLKLDVASPADIDATFNLFDEDHSGSIELQELQRLLHPHAPISKASAAASAAARPSAPPRRQCDSASIVVRLASSPTHPSSPHLGQHVDIDDSLLPGAAGPMESWGRVAPPSLPQRAASSEAAAEESAARAADAARAKASRAEAKAAARAKVVEAAARVAAEEAAEAAEAMAEVAGALTVGDRCEVHPGGKPATVRYVGKIPALGPGWWVGVQYDKAIGKNNGSVKGERLFQCPPKCGGFLRPDKVTVIGERNGTGGAGGVPSHQFALRRKQSSRTLLRIADGEVEER